MSNPLDDFLEDVSQPEKTASVIGSIGRGLAYGGGAALGAVGLAAVASGAGAAYDAASKKRDYTAMLKVNPHLEDARKQDPAMFNQMYTSLRSANRAFAKDPFVAGRYMSRMLDEPMAAGGVLTEAMTATNVRPRHMSDDLMGAYRSGYSIR